MHEAINGTNSFIDDGSFNHVVFKTFTEINGDDTTEITGFGTNIQSINSDEVETLKYCPNLFLYWDPKIRLVNFPALKTIIGNGTFKGLVIPADDMSADGKDYQIKLPELQSIQGDDTFSYVVLTEDLILNNLTNIVGDRTFSRLMSTGKIRLGLLEQLSDEDPTDEIQSHDTFAQMILGEIDLPKLSTIEKCHGTFRDVILIADLKTFNAPTLAGEFQRGLHDVQSLSLPKLSVLTEAESTFESIGAKVVELPSLKTVTRSGSFFQNCKVEEVKMPVLETLGGDGAFLSSKMGTLNLPQLTKYIGEDPFSGSDVTVIDLPKLTDWTKYDSNGNEVDFDVTEYPTFEDMQGAVCLYIPNLKPPSGVAFKLSFKGSSKLKLVVAHQPFIKPTGGVDFDFAVHLPAFTGEIDNEFRPNVLIAPYATYVSVKNSNKPIYVNTSSETTDFKNVYTRDNVSKGLLVRKTDMSGVQRLSFRPEFVEKLSESCPIKLEKEVLVPDEDNLLNEPVAPRIDPSKLYADASPALYIDSLVQESYAGGDPYLFPLLGPSTKIPNVEEVYRLYQDENVVVNAKVQQASAKVQKQITDLMGDNGAFVATSTEAYFFSHLLIQVGSHHALVDLDARSVTGDYGQSIRVGKPALTHDHEEYDTQAQSQVSIPIRWGQDTCLTVRFSRNPQVQNGLRLTGSQLYRGSGLLVRNYRHKLFSLRNNLWDVSPVQLPTNLRRTLTQKTYVEQRVLVQVG
jgi:hypothetical protein